MSTKTNVPLNSVIVPLRISKAEYLKYYVQQGIQVYATGIDGRSVSFPAKILQRYVTHNGIEGVFEIFFDPSGHFHSVAKRNT